MFLGAGAGEDLGGHFFAPGCLFDLVFQFVQAVLAGTGSSLVGGDDNPFDPGQVIDGFQGHHHDDGGAVGVGDDPMMFGDVLGIHFRDDQGHIRVHPVGAGVVDDYGPGLDSDGSKGLGDAAAGEQGHIHSIEGIGLGFFHFIGLAPDGEFLAGAAGRCQQFQVLEGEIPFVQQIDEFLSNGARSTQDGQIVFFHGIRLLCP